MNPSHPPFSGDDILLWLAKHPASLEPGVVFADDPLALDAGLSIPLWGADPLGRPCLVLWFQDWGPEAFDLLMDCVARLRAEGERLAKKCGRPREPRVFVLATNYPRTVLQRLLLLGDAFPLRAFSVDADTTITPPEPTFTLESSVAAPSPDNLLTALAEPNRSHALRLLHSAEALRPAVQIQAAAWPLVFRSQHGPCASLYLDGEQLVLACRGSLGVESFLLDEDEQVDRAIDVFMREQRDLRMTP